jgi:hypothetical protein
MTTPTSRAPKTAPKTAPTGAQTDTMQPPTHADFVRAVVERYKEKSWGVFTADGKINDIIAKYECVKDGKIVRSKYHFVRVNPAPEAANMNNFIQNAFSNEAVPVVAKVSAHRNKLKKIEYRITFSDANTNANIRV